MNVVVLYNKISDDALEDELDVLKQLEVVSRALSQLGYIPFPVPFSLDISSAIHSINKIEPDFIFNLTESVDSKDELIYFAPAIIQTLGIPYTGCGLEPMFITTNKLLTKKQLKYHNISTSDWLTLDELYKLNPADKYILKPLWSEGSLGLDEDSVFMGNNKAFIEKIEAIKNKNSFFIEKFIDGREFNISVVYSENGPQVLPPAEIIFKDYPAGKHNVVGYTAKWKPDSFEYNNTVRTFSYSNDDNKLLDELRNICISCWNKFNIKGYTRVDFRVDSNNIPYVLEINANPCLSTDAGFAAAVNEAGLTFNEAISRIIKDLNN